MYANIRAIGVLNVVCGSEIVCCGVVNKTFLRKVQNAGYYTCVSDQFQSIYFEQNITFFTSDYSLPCAV
jgi:hypothetical protein